MSPNNSTSEYGKYLRIIIRTISQPMNQMVSIEIRHCWQPFRSNHPLLGIHILKKIL